MDTGYFTFARKKTPQKTQLTPWGENGITDRTKKDQERFVPLFKSPSEGCTGDPAAALTDIGRRPKLPTYHPGWFPNLYEMPGMIKDSALVAARSGPSPSMRLCREWVGASDGCMNILLCPNFGGIIIPPTVRYDLLGLPVRSFLRLTPWKWAFSKKSLQTFEQKKEGESSRSALEQCCLT